MSGFRRYGRKAVRCTVRLTHADLGEVFTEAKDISDMGVFLNYGNTDAFSIGDTFEATLYTIDDEASNATLTVVRKTPQGLALSFD